MARRAVPAPRVSESGAEGLQQSRKITVSHPGLKPSRNSPPPFHSFRPALGAGKREAGTSQRDVPTLDAHPLVGTGALRRPRHGGGASMALNGVHRVEWDISRDLLRPLQPVPPSLIQAGTSQRDVLTIPPPPLPPLARPHI